MHNAQTIKFYYYNLEKALNCFEIRGIIPKKLAVKENYFSNFKKELNSIFKEQFIGKDNLEELITISKFLGEKLKQELSLVNEFQGEIEEANKELEKLSEILSNKEKITHFLKEGSSQLAKKYKSSLKKLFLISTVVLVSACGSSGESKVNLNSNTPKNPIEHSVTNESNLEKLKQNILFFKNEAIASFLDEILLPYATTNTNSSLIDTFLKYEKSPQIQSIFILTLSELDPKVLELYLEKYPEILEKFLKEIDSIKAINTTSEFFMNTHHDIIETALNIRKNNLSSKNSIFNEKSLSTIEDLYLENEEIALFFLFSIALDFQNKANFIATINNFNLDNLDDFNKALEEILHHDLFLIKGSFLLSNQDIKNYVNNSDLVDVNLFKIAFSSIIHKKISLDEIDIIKKIFNEGTNGVVYDLDEEVQKIISMNNLELNRQNYSQVLLSFIIK